MTDANAIGEHTTSDNAAVARRALERVCSGREVHALAEVYDERFVDHVNAMEFRGHEGAQRSVALYRSLFPDLRFEVLDQVGEGDKVANRWALHGTHRGRAVRLTGLTISRFERGRIVEDWGATDTIELARQLGVWRTVLLVLRHSRLLLDPTGQRLPGR